MDEQIKPIQLPVRYDKTACQLVDAAEAAWLDVDALDYDDRDICEAMVKQIADALNATRREDALVERMEAGRHYLMSVDAEAITVEDALEAFGFGRNGLA